MAGWMGEIRTVAGHTRCTQAAVRQRLGNPKFKGCLGHKSEPKCRVRNLVRGGGLSIKKQKGGQFLKAR